ncbi:NAD(P)-binding protein [Gymnopus androsaceus JB14]|uniref:NAD(P)-binding protein n=1 Tax=Gymnopus androsaceus JB14 TaxID=1447944 RepID=A0A6A4I8J1_9AGAR|nr:NAD(P)-binding protein [Gymnopus androsaceus JB14]
MKNGRVIFNEIPKGNSSSFPSYPGYLLSSLGYPVPGRTTIYDDSQSIDIDTVPLNGSILIKVLVLSIDPYLRGKMRSAEVESYSPAFHLNEPLYNHGVGVILRSESSDPAFKPGTHVYAYVGAAGMPGQTAYYGWQAYANPKPNEVVFVSTAGGPVGSMVVQIAKRAGCKVIASAGSAEKVAFAKSIGADVAFNYKEQDTAEVLKKEGPIDIYWENVGGSTLDAFLGNAANHARVIVCGMISGYNDSTGDGVNMKNLLSFLTRRIHLNGFLVMEFYKEFPKQLASGELKWSEDVTKGLIHAGEAILEVQEGRNTAKKVIVVAEE